ncbi:MAG: hypothetical protein F6K42_12140, partial [Leptolyngbya sp. SIO1D8]|nr:hypothetical protein [Leptolyngbya sp. SIO1D8]
SRLACQSGTQIIPGYYNTDVLSSYAPLNIQGVNWGIVSEMALSEAYAPINNLQDYLLVSVVILILLVSLFATIVAERFTRPIDLMVQYSRDAESSDLINQLDTTAQNEFSELAQMFNRVVQQIRQKTTVIEQKEQEKEKLLLNILPRPVAERWRQGKTHVVDQAQQVTVLVIQIAGLENASNQLGYQTVADGLDELVTLLDEKGEPMDVERFNCFGDRYVAACGLTKPRLDHTKQALDFAQNALTLIKEVNQKYDLSLSLQIGIHTGAVTAALIGQRKFQYDLWGEPINIANQLAQKTEANTIRVTQSVYERAQDLFPGDPDQSVVLADNRTLSTWVLGKTGIRDLIGEITSGLGLDDEDSLDAPIEAESDP